MPDRLLTPSKITAWLDCAHYLNLRHQADDSGKQPRMGFGAFAQLIVDKGLEHEAACLTDYEDQGRTVHRVPDRNRGESFSAYVARVGNPMADGHDVIYQMPFIHDGVRGVADFLERVDLPDGSYVYEPVDAKLSREHAKPGHVLQLCFYAEAIGALTGRAPERIHLWLGKGRIEPLPVADYQAYWRRIRQQLVVLLDDEVDTDTRPQPNDHCNFCEFFAVCEDTWRSADSLIYLAGLRATDRQVLEEGSVETIQALAERQEPVDGIRPDRQIRIITQAKLQVAAREAEGAPPPYQLIAPGEDPVWGRGFEGLPLAAEGDVFLDFEGHPFWRPDAGLFFLFGLIEADAGGAWHYRRWWADDSEQEKANTEALIDYLAARRTTYPDMHVYHYNHTERSALERLAVDHSVGEVTLAEMIETGLFVDLFLVARNALQAGTETYGLKDLERLTTYERSHDIDAGAGAVIEYELFRKDRKHEHVDRIAAYNEDDVRATQALRDWLAERHSDDLRWRAAHLEPTEVIPELDENVARLHAFGPDTSEHLLGDVLGYWRREWFAYLAPRLAVCQGDPADLVDEPDVITGLEFLGPGDRRGRTGKVLGPAMRFAIPPQAIEKFRGDDQVIYPTPDGIPGYSTICRFDPDAGELDLQWSERCQELAVVPTTIAQNGWVRPKPKPEALNELATRILDPTGPAPQPVALALLRREPPVFLTGSGPVGGQFDDEPDHMIEWVTGLDRTVVAVQGPPGTGKTYRGALLIHRLLEAGQRVGITAFSHHAIDNLLEATVATFTKKDDLDRLHAVRRVPRSRPSTPQIEYVTTNPPATRPEFNLVAGTTWLFAGNDMLAAPVDVLIVDEAGQLSLADALACTRSAKNLILLGDPLQLPQVSQASHPAPSGESVLGHVLGSDPTVPADRGVFIEQTWRMHPDVCEFISTEIYEGRLRSHPDCARQTTIEGTGLRWLRATHVECSTSSLEEAELIAEEVDRLIGTDWTDRDGNVRPLEAEADFMVVAPYNDQVDLIGRVLARSQRTAGVPVGTVDKFQGRQAAVVFFSMATSSRADLARGADFLFSRQRLNVAISRARCLAYLVCTEALLNSRARDVEEMKLLSTLCAFAERCP